MAVLDYETFARQVLDICLGVKPGDRVWINTWDFDTELASELAWQCAKRQCRTFTTVQFEDTWTRSIVEAPVELLENIPVHQAAALKETDVYVFTLGPRTIPWDKIPAERRKLVTIWFLEHNKFVEQWKAIAQARRLKMLGLEATLATPERAKVLGLNFEDWRNVMFEGCMADYKAMGKDARELSQLMSRTGKVHITTPQGTDFKFNLDNRPVDWFDGIITDEMRANGRPAFLPAGGIEASAEETSAEGKVVFDSPILSLVREGRIERLMLTVSRGRIARFTAATQEQAFGRWLKEGSGDVDRFGFFGFGLNPNLKHGFTQDDKVRGGVTLGFGDNTDKAGRNKADRGFWASMTGATVTIDDRLVMRDGHLSL